MTEVTPDLLDQTALCRCAAARWIVRLRSGVEGVLWHWPGTGCEESKVKVRIGGRFQRVRASEVLTLRPPGARMEE